MSIIKDSLYGFAIGDAMGVPIEFENRDKLKNNLVTSMLGYGSYDVPKGTWSDDTSMTLATIDSLINNKGELNYNDIADKFCDWINNATYTATGEIFDIGITTKYALMRYWNDKTDATKCGGSGFLENGNGSLMRMLPIAWYAYYNKLEDEEIVKVVRNVSSITHAHDISIMGCYIYVKYVLFLLQGYDKYTSYKMVKDLDYKEFSEEANDEYKRFLNSDIAKAKLDDISSTGYVVYTLETVMWVILNCSSYNETIIGAINLGGDTDTIGAICGSIAGILYGFDNINKKWLKDLEGKDKLNYYIASMEKIFHDRI